MGEGRNEWREEEGEKNEGLKVQWRTKVTKWQCLTATSILKWCPCHAVLPSIDFFFYPWSTEGKKKKNLIQLKQIPAAGTGPLLAAIKVNAGATLIKVSLLLLRLLFLPPPPPPPSPHTVCGWSLMDWSPCSAGSLFISSIQKPPFSAKKKNASSSCHISLRLLSIFLQWLRLPLEGHATWKIIRVKLSSGGEK